MFERCVYFNTNALARKLNSHWEKAFARFNLAPSQGYLLRVVLNEPGLSQKELAAALQLEKSTVARFINTLEEKGFVRRNTSAKDQRENGIFPTQKSLKIQSDLDVLGAELYATLCSKLGKARVKELVEVMRELNSQL